jgi:hypothetical protein
MSEPEKVTAGPEIAGGVYLDAKFDPKAPDTYHNGRGDKVSKDGTVLASAQEIAQGDAVKAVEEARRQEEAKRASAGGRTK